MAVDNNAIYRLRTRALLRVGGDDAEVFLQNLLTQNVAGLGVGVLVYGCLLTPQGRFLHDMFVFRDGAGFILDCEAARMEDLLRRFKIFRLRAKVTLEPDTALEVYAGARQEGFSFADPRLPALGYRSYLSPRPADEESFYRDQRLSLGVPEGSPEIKPEIDTMADASLDLLQAVSWNKGCFVGQEVAARMHNRGLTKRRMALVTGAGLQPGALAQGGVAAGEVRAVNAAGTQGIAVVKLAAMAETASFLHENGTAVTVRMPDWATA